MQVLVGVSFLLGLLCYALFSSAHHPGVVRPRAGPYPLGIATELPATGVALAQDSCGASSKASARVAAVAREPRPPRDDSMPIASATAWRAVKLCPLSSASQYGSAATMPPTCTENSLAAA